MSENLPNVQSGVQHIARNGLESGGVREWHLDRRWVLPVLVLVVGSVSLLLNDIDGRTRQVVSDVVAVERALSKESAAPAARAESVELQVEVAVERIVAIVPLLSRLTVSFGAATLLLAGTAGFRRELPRALRAGLVVFALYCGFRIFLALH